MNGKVIKVNCARNYEPKLWGLAIEDSLGVTYAWMALDRRIVERLVSELNSAADDGAPWKKLGEFG